MARTGRPRKPTVLKMISGSRNIPETAESEPQPEGGPVPPMPLSEVAQKYWDRKVAEAYWLTSADSEALMYYCNAAALYEEAMEDIKKHGVYVRKNSWSKTTTYKSGKQSITQYDGVRMRSPAEEIVNRQIQVLAKIGSELGFTAVGRTRIVVPEGKKPQGGQGAGDQGSSTNRFAANAANRG